jgi:putative membrane protein
MEQNRVSVPKARHGSEFLANERTFLAWVRTGVAVASLGFVVSKFGLWLRQISARVGQTDVEEPSRASLPIGIAMIALGGLLVALAAWRYHRINQLIEKGEIRADRGLVVLVTVAITALCAAMIAYMLGTT